MRRFSIRDLLWLTVVVGLGVGWSIEHYRSVMPPTMCFGIPNDFSGHLNEAQEQELPAAVRGAYYVESVREISAADLAQMKQGKQEFAEERVRACKFVAVRGYRCVSFPGGMTGQMIVVERYRVVDP